MKTLMCLLALLSVCIVSGSAQSTPSSSGATVDPKHYLKIGKGVVPPRPVDTPQPVPPTPTCPVKRTATVVLWIGIGEAGNVEAAKVTRSADSDLDKKALEQVKQCKFTPATKNGMPAPVQTNAEFHFSLC